MTTATTTTVQLTDAQLAQFTACGVIVVDGEAVHYDGLENAWVNEIRRPDLDHVGAEPRKLTTVPPELWRKLTEPCATCGGTSSVEGRNIASYDHCWNPECVDGRRVVTLTSGCHHGIAGVEGWWCDCGDGLIDQEHATVGACGTCLMFNDAEPCSGVATVGRFTVRLLPVVAAPDWPTGAYVQRFSNGDVVVVSADRSETTLLALDPLPHPGQYAVQFEAVAP